MNTWKTTASLVAVLGIQSAAFASASISSLTPEDLEREEQDLRRDVEAFCNSVPRIQQLQTQMRQLPDSISTLPDKYLSLIKLVGTKCFEIFGEEKLLAEKENYSMEYEIAMPCFDDLTGSEDPSFRHFSERIQHFVMLFPSEILPLIRQLHDLTHIQFPSKIFDKYEWNLGKPLQWLSENVEKIQKINIDFAEIKAFDNPDYAAQLKTWWGLGQNILGDVRRVCKACRDTHFEEDVDPIGLFQRVEKAFCEELGAFLTTPFDQMSQEDQTALAADRNTREQHTLRFYRDATDTELKLIPSTCHAYAVHRVKILDLDSFLKGLNLTEQQVNYFENLYTCSNDEYLKETRSFVNLFVKFDPADLVTLFPYEGFSVEGVLSFREFVDYWLKAPLLSSKAKAELSQMLDDDAKEQNQERRGEMMTLMAKGVVDNWVRSSLSNPERKGEIIALMALFRSQLSPFEMVFGYGSQRLEDNKDWQFRSLDRFRKLHFKLGNSSCYESGGIQLDLHTSQLLHFGSPTEVTLGSSPVKLRTKAKEEGDQKPQHLVPGHSTAQNLSFAKGMASLSEIWETLDHECGHYLQEWVRTFEDRITFLQAKLVRPLQTVSANPLDPTSPQRFQTGNIVKKEWDNLIETEQISGLAFMNLGSDDVDRYSLRWPTTGKRILCLNCLWSDPYVGKKTRFGHGYTGTWKTAQSNARNAGIQLGQPVATEQLAELQRLFQHEGSSIASRMARRVAD